MIALALLAVALTPNGRRYADMISEKQQGDPTFYIIHHWGCSFANLMETIQEYVKQVGALCPSPACSYGC